MSLLDKDLKIHMTLHLRIILSKNQGSRVPPSRPVSEVEDEGRRIGRRNWTKDKGIGRKPKYERRQTKDA